MNLKATIIGATGLVGDRLTGLLLDDFRFESVHLFVRHSTGIKHRKLIEHIVDFENINDWSGQIEGDVLFSTLGTTLKKAGGKEKQYHIDFDYQYEVAKAAAKNGVENLILVSSLGANPKSAFFYSRMKGELEMAVQKLPFKKIMILRPSILTGEREEKRPAETFSIIVARLFTSFMLRKYRPISARTVAQAMINSIFYNNFISGTFIYQYEELFILGDR